MEKFAVISPIFILKFFDEQVTSPYQELKTGRPALNTVSVLTKLSLLPYADTTSSEVRLQNKFTHCKRIRNNTGSR